MQTDTQAGSFWMTMVGGGVEGFWEKEQGKRGRRGGCSVVAVFIDNKWWDALVSARPTEPDDRHAAKRSCDRITHSVALQEGLLSKGGKHKWRGRGEEGRGTEGGRDYPWTPSRPLPSFIYAVYKQTFFFLFHSSFGVRASLPLFFGHWPQLVRALTMPFHNPAEQKPFQTRKHKRWQLGLWRAQSFTRDDVSPCNCLEWHGRLWSNDRPRRRSSKGSGGY